MKMVFKKGHKINIGRIRSENTKEKIRLTNLGQKRSIETCENISKYQKGRKKGPHTKERKINIGIANKEAYKSEKLREECRVRALEQFKNGMPESTKEKLRKIQIKVIEEKYGLKPNGLCPNIGKYETQILDNLEKCFNYPILRQYRVAGYFLDGYCPALNLAIEVDEKYHKKPEQLQKDNYRQKMIENKLNCRFLRMGD